VGHGISLLKTLARKHRSAVSMMARKYKATIDTPQGPRVCFQTTVERGEGNALTPPTCTAARCTRSGVPAQGVAP
jgi:hypothetical protein